MQELKSLCPRCRSHQLAPVPRRIVDKRPAGLNVDQIEQKAFKLVFLRLQVLEERSDKIVGKRAHLGLRPLDKDLARAATALPNLTPAAVAEYEQVLLQRLLLHIAPAGLQFLVRRFIHHDSHLLVHVVQVRLLVERPVRGQERLALLRCHDRRGSTRPTRGCRAGREAIGVGLRCVVRGGLRRVSRPSTRQDNVEDVRHVAAIAGELDLIERAHGEETTPVVDQRSVERDWREGQSFEPLTGEVVAEKHVLFRQRLAGGEDELVRDRVLSDQLLQPL